MKTLAFSAVFGLRPGYFDPKAIYDEEDIRPDRLAARLWQHFMEEEYKTTGILVTAVVHQSLTVYPVAMGCPPGGEGTVTVAGHLNPKFYPPMAIHEPQRTYEIKEYWQTYKRAVERICSKMKAELKQTTVSIAFYELEDFVYLSSK